MLLFVYRHAHFVSNHPQIQQAAIAMKLKHTRSTKIGYRGDDDDGVTEELNSAANARNINPSAHHCFLFTFFTHAFNL